MLVEGLLFEEIEEVIAPTDAQFWGGVAVGVGGVLIVGALCC